MKTSYETIRTGASRHCPGAPDSDPAWIEILSKRAGSESGAPSTPAVSGAVPGCARFALAAMVGLAVINGFLAYSSQALVNDFHRAVIHAGVKLPNFSQAAFELPPLFYALAGVAALLAGLGFWDKALDHKLAYGAFALLLLDVAGLFAMLWGFGVVHFVM